MIEQKEDFHPLSVYSLDYFYKGLYEQNHEKYIYRTKSPMSILFIRKISDIEFYRVPFF